MPRLSTICGCVIVLLNCGVFFSTALFAFDGQAYQPQPVAATPAEPVAPVDDAHAGIVKETGALCKCLADAEGDCDAISETVIIFDASSSMSDLCEPGGLQKLQVAQWALSDILDAVPTRHSVGLLCLEKNTSILQPLGPLTGEAKSKLRRAAMEKKAVGNATLKGGLDAIRDMLKTHKGEPRLISVIVLTDGMTCRPAEAQPALEELAKQNRIRFEVLCIGCNRTRHEEFNSLARPVNGRVDLICSTRDLPQALAIVRRDYDDAWKCSQCLHERCRQRLVDCCSEQNRLSSELKQRLAELGDARKEGEALISAFSVVSKIEKTVTYIGDVSNNIFDESQKVSKQVQDCDQKVQRLEKIENQTNEESKTITIGVNHILEKLSDCSDAEAIHLLEEDLLLLNKQSETIDVDIRKILKRLNDWPATVRSDPQLLADEIYLRTQFWLFLLVLLLIAQFLLILACLLRPGRGGGSRNSSVLDCSKPPVIPLATPPNDLPAAGPCHESEASHSSCPPKTPAPPTNTSKYLGSGKHTGKKPPKPDGLPNS